MAARRKINQKRKRKRKRMGWDDIRLLSSPSSFSPPLMPAACCLLLAACCLLCCFLALPAKLGKQNKYCRCTQQFSKNRGKKGSPGWKGKINLSRSPAPCPAYVQGPPRSTQTKGGHPLPLVSLVEGRKRETTTKNKPMQKKKQKEKKDKKELKKRKRRMVQYFRDQIIFFMLNHL